MVQLALPEGDSVQEIRAGYEHAIALSEDGKVWASGIGTDGQLGRGDDLDQHAFSRLSLPSQLAEEGVAAVEAGADTSAILSSEGNLWTFGNSVGLAAFRQYTIRADPDHMSRSTLRPSKATRLTGYSSLRLSTPRLWKARKWRASRLADHSPSCLTVSQIRSGKPFFRFIYAMKTAGAI